MSDWSAPPSPSQPPPGARPTNPTYNPYTPPSARLGAETRTPDDAERIRREHLSHEASIRSVGTLYRIGAILTALGTLVMLALGVVNFFQPGDAGAALGLLLVGAIYGFLTWLQFYLGNGLRELDPKVRTLVTILTAIGLIGFPVGTLISAYILYLLHSAKGKRIMTPEYRAIVASTPHIQYKTPLWMILVVVALIGVIVLAIFAAMA